jgi:hypothetical protein
LKRSNQAEVLRQLLILGVVTLHGHVRGSRMGCLGDTTGTFEELSAFMLSNCVTIELV